MVFSAFGILTQTQSQMASIVSECRRFRCVEEQEAAAHETQLNFFSTQILLYYVLTFVNFLLQIFCIRFLIKRKNIGKGAFFSLLLILSLSVTFRVFFSIVTISVSAIIGDRKDERSVLLLQSSLYVDYCSNFFSLSLIFLMSLTRCFSFISSTLNSFVFKGLRLLFPVVSSALLSVIGATVAIRTSEIRRTLVELLGIVDIGPNKGLRVVVNRSFYIFPFGSIVCYIALYCHMRKQTRLMVENSHQTRGEHQVAFHLMITSVLYGLLSITYEVAIISSRTEDPDSQLTFISILNMFNVLPELILPLLFICGNIQMRKRISILVTPNIATIAKGPNTRSAVGL